jgi:FdhD protein
MSAVSHTTNHKVIHWSLNQSRTDIHQTLIREEPLSIRVQGKPYAVIMRTPGDEIAHGAGFCFAEGVVDIPQEIRNIAFCNGEESNVVTITLTPERHAKAISHLDRKGYLSQTSCGICGKELVEDIQETVAPIESKAVIPLSDILTCTNDLPALQPLRDQTRATHGVAIYDQDIKLISSAEDVGRHNALDKAIGKLFLENQLHYATLLILSSRISYELVQKAARAKIAVIVAYSRPTELAVNLAASLGMTLVCLAKDNGLFVFCNSQRLKF